MHFAVASVAVCRGFTGLWNTRMSTTALGRGTRDRTIEVFTTSVARPTSSETNAIRILRTVTVGETLLVAFPGVSIADAGLTFVVPLTALPDYQVSIRLASPVHGVTMVTIGALHRVYAPAGRVSISPANPIVVAATQPVRRTVLLAFAFGSAPLVIPFADADECAERVVTHTGISVGTIDPRCGIAFFVRETTEATGALFFGIGAVAFGP